MTTLVPAVKGEMGSTPYYMAKMKAREFTASTRAASDLDDWMEFGIEERMQRELNETRIREEIVPYLTNSADRFFGAFVVLIYRGTVKFQPLLEVVSKETVEEAIDKLRNAGHEIPYVYQSAVGDIGFLLIDGGQLIVLDGQHRRAALKTVIEGDATGEFANAVGNDELEVVFIEFDGDEADRSSEKIRRIFNKLNRHAKPTGRSDDIITSEDDGYAILARRLLRLGEPLGVPITEKRRGETIRDVIVNWRSTTIAARSLRFTTISAVYETVKTVCGLHGVDPRRWDEKKSAVRPSDAELDEAYEHVQHWWDTLLNGVAVFKEALNDPTRLPEFRVAEEPYSLLFKPAAHIVLFRALGIATGRGLDLVKAVDRLNAIDWNIESDLWKGILIQPNGRITARKENYDVTAELIAYLISADTMSAEDKEQVRETVEQFREDSFQLPTPVVS